jgi:hypothetical protein
MVWKCPPLNLVNWSNLWKWKQTMADITMCRDETCKKRERCYRFTARVTPEYQSYFVDTPRQGKVCKYFSDNEDKTKRLRKNCE